MSTCVTNIVLYFLCSLAFPLHMIGDGVPLELVLDRATYISPRARGARPTPRMLWTSGGELMWMEGGAVQLHLHAAACRPGVPTLFRTLAKQLGEDSLLTAALGNWHAVQSSPQTRTQRCYLLKSTPGPRQLW